MNVVFSWLTAFVLSTTPAGSGGGTYIFDGFLLCTNPRVLGGCLKNGTHLVTIPEMSLYDCYALKQTADAIPGGAGGTCIKEKEKRLP